MHDPVKNLFDVINRMGLKATFQNDEDGFPDDDFKGMSVEQKLTILSSYVWSGIAVRDMGGMETLIEMIDKKEG